MKHALRYLLLLLLAPLVGQASPQSSVPDEIKPFILSNHQILDYAEGDINNDQRPDAVVILASVNEKKEGESEGDPDRPLLLLIRQASGKLAQVHRNDSVVLCQSCGGVMGDPYQELQIVGNNGFRLSFYGGSAERWGITYQFSYKSTLKDWYLTQESFTAFNSTDAGNTQWDYTIPENEFMEPLLFHQFTGEVMALSDEGRVKAKKAYFYPEPQLNAKPRSAYLIKGDIFSIHLETKNFYKASYTHPKTQKLTRGFLLKRDSEKLFKK